MKIFLLGFFLIASIGLNGQTYVSPEEALTILADKTSAEQEELEYGQLDESSAVFAEKKYNVESYYILTAKLNGGMDDIAQGIRQTVFEVKNGGVTDQEYDNDNIADPDLSRIKENLETILTQ